MELTNRSFAERSLDLIALVDSKERICRLSPSFQQLLEDDSSAAIGGPLRDHVHPDDTLDLACQLLQASRHGSAHSRFRLHHHAGTWRWIETALLRIGDDHRPNLLVVGHDVTCHMELETQLERVEQLATMGQLASGVVHEINNALTAITCSAALGQAALPSKHPAQEELAAIVATANSAATSARSMLTLARQSGATCSALDLNNLMTSLERLLRALAGPGFGLRLRLESNLPMVCADANQIGQVIVNLALNARDAMPNGGALVIQTRAIPRGCHTGGALANTRARLFEPFFTTKAPGRGTGLGLVTCKAIVTQHAEQLVVESEIGSGTTVSMYLPSVTHALDGVDGVPGAMTSTVRRLVASAQHHAAYAVLNDGDASAWTGGPHGEVVGKPGFSGQTPGDRVTAAGFPYPVSAEVIDYVGDPQHSVDDLMATVFHRVGVLLAWSRFAGYGLGHGTAAAFDVLDFGHGTDEPPTTPGVVVFPAPEQADVPLVGWDEQPSAVPPGAPYPFGYHVTIQPTTGAGLAVTTAELRDDTGGLVPVYPSPAACDAACYALTPIAPLRPTTTYHTSPARSTASHLC